MSVCLFACVTSKICYNNIMRNQHCNILIGACLYSIVAFLCTLSYQKLTWDLELIWTLVVQYNSGAVKGIMNNPHSLLKKIMLNSRMT